MVGSREAEEEDWERDVQDVVVRNMVVKDTW